MRTLTCLALLFIGLVVAQEAQAGRRGRPYEVRTYSGYTAPSGNWGSFVDDRGRSYYWSRSGRSTTINDNYGRSAYFYDSSLPAYNPPPPARLQLRDWQPIDDSDSWNFFWKVMER